MHGRCSKLNLGRARRCASSARRTARAQDRARHGAAFNLPIEICRRETVRADDGLACRPAALPSPRRAGRGAATCTACCAHRRCDVAELGRSKAMLDADVINYWGIVGARGNAARDRRAPQRRRCRKCSRSPTCASASSAEGARARARHAASSSARSSSAISRTGRSDRRGEAELRISDVSAFARRSASQLPGTASTSADRADPRPAVALEQRRQHERDHGVATPTNEDGPAPTRFSSVRYAPNANTLPNSARYASDST